MTASTAVAGLLLAIRVRDECALALVHLPIGGREFRTENVMRQSFCVAVPKNHPLAGRKQVRLAQLRQDAFLQLREGLQFRTIVQEILRRAQIEPDIVFESSSMENILAMVSAGAGISLVPEMAAVKRRGCRFIAVEDSRQTGIDWAMLKLHKGKYIYYRCSYGRGKCGLPYMREPALSEQLGTILKDIYVLDHVVRAVVVCMAGDQDRAEAQREAQVSSARQRLAVLRTRMDQAYEDKLDGKLDEQMWTRKMKDWRDQEVELEATLCRLETAVRPQNMLIAQRILELANCAYSLYRTRNHAERGQLLKSVRLNCAIDGVNLTPTYRKPFDLIFRRAKNEEWSGRGDLNSRPPAPKAGALPGCATPRHKDPVDSTVFCDCSSSERSDDRARTVHEFCRSARI